MAIHGSKYAHKAIQWKPCEMDHDIIRNSCQEFKMAGMIIASLPRSIALANVCHTDVTPLLFIAFQWHFGTTTNLADQSEA